MSHGVIPGYMNIPFVLLLLSIAVLPLIAPGFWESNRNKAWIALGLSIPILWYLLPGSTGELVEALEEYLSFIIMLGALYIISGGILITGDLRATPLINTMVLLVGAVLANLIGTTGASMVLIRPLLKTNRERRMTKHIPVFFIFIVSNIGGALTPLGDPPLFLGYLRGVSFTWNLSLFPQWLTVIGILLVLFYFWDRNCYRKETEKSIREDETKTEPVTITGKVNFLFLLGVVSSITLQVPAPYRELVMMLMMGLSLGLTAKSLRDANGFSWHPIAEVAILFVGIFITMKPLMMTLDGIGGTLGIAQPWQYFWITGGLSSFLDNAPTYATMFSLGQSVTKSLGGLGLPVIAGVRGDLLTAISCGAVFMGANTYIGNGPNFMVKAIAEDQGFNVPHFFEYCLYSVAILIPIFIFVTLLFFR